MAWGSLKRGTRASVPLALAGYKRQEEKEEYKGHNHPAKEKCGPHCPRNEHYRGPVKKPGFLPKRKR